MNARYNAYFYSREYMKESTKKVEKANKDDFTRILPLFIYTSNENAKDYYADFDKTIKKSSLVIHRHAIMNPKTKEEIPNACRWIDENYMLIGKSHFYKREFFTALEMFEYVAKKYPNPEAKYLGMLWMIRTNNEIGSFSKSEQIIDDLRNAEDFPKKDKFFQSELAAVSADFYIKKSEYGGAIPQLTKAIEVTKKKMTKARYTYVLAQLYEKSGNDSEASKYYQMVPKYHPSYDMEFNAKINHARLHDVKNGDTKAIKKELARMIKDEKNKEFLDQIYYALAEIVYKEKDIPLAINYLDKSIQESVSNNGQKALSYLKRADIYFEKTNYKEAEANYDSTMTVLPKDYPDYDLIAEKKKNLNALVANLNIIALEDSVQRLAKMSEKDRNAAIDGMISKVEEEEKKKEEERQNELNNPPPQNQTTTTTTQTNNSSWYFYNPTTVSFGVAEFTKKWGSRKLEDNWRRSEKAQDILAATATNDDEEVVDSVETKNKDVVSDKGSKNKKDRSFYLKKVPLTPDAVAKSNVKIIDAYYNAGSIYKEQLLNNVKATETFEELLKRFPDNKYKISCYYQLYRTCLVMNNTTKADYYKNILLKDYPDSEYAKIIKNPSYAKDIMASKSEVEKFYAETYQLYSEGKYSAALVNCQLADTSYAKSYLIPQFDFVKALCIGRTQDINSFESALTQVVIKYPKEPVKNRAQEILDLIRKQKTPESVAIDTLAVTSAVVDSTQAKPKFIFKEDGDYYWVAIIENGKGDINKFKTKLSDINEASFGTKELNISSVFLDVTHQLVSVKSFEGKADAMNYYNFFKDNKPAFADLEIGTYKSFIISADNYIIFYKDKNIGDYQQFFTQNFK
jgi:tetratricopeptide (TPR) repeat protein